MSRPTVPRREWHPGTIVPAASNDTEGGPSETASVGRPLELRGRCGLGECPRASCRQLRQLEMGRPPVPPPLCGSGPVSKGAPGSGPGRAGPGCEVSQRPATGGISSPEREWSELGRFGAGRRRSRKWPFGSLRREVRCSSGRAMWNRSGIEVEAVAHILR